MKGVKAQTRRDLTLISGVGDKWLVIACDSCGAVGEKSGDILELPAHYVGKFTVRVALTEVLCSGATPITVINGAANEMKPTAENFIFGIEEELKNAGISNIVLTGSTEENFITNMTSLAVTVIGIASESDLKFGKAVRGDKLILLGSPSVGSEVYLESKGFYDEIRHLLTLAEVREIVPVGSKGINYEAENLAAMNGMVFRHHNTKDTAEIDLYKSAGPVTCLIVLCSETAACQILEFHQNVVILGEFK